MATTSRPDRKSTRLNSSHLVISYAVFCLKKKKKKQKTIERTQIRTRRADAREDALRAVLFGLYSVLVLSCCGCCFFFFFFFFFFNDTATTEIYTLSLHDALPI